MQRFRESTTGYSRVNRELGIIFDVRIINTTSRNRRRYLESALRDGIPLYEGATIGIDHVKPTPGNPAPEREFTKFWGQLNNVRWDGEGLIGDLHYIKSHHMTEHILEAAERFPEKFGLSHDADGDSKVGADGWLEVYKLTKVFSVDLVTNPGSTNGLFESMQQKESLIVRGSFKEGFILGGQTMSTVDSTVSGKHLFEEMMADEGMMQEMGSDSMMMESEPGLEEAFKAEAMKVLDDSSMDSAGKLAKLKAIFKAKDQVMATLGSGDMAKTTTATESVEGAADDEDEEDDEDTMKESVKKQIGNLQEENRQLKAKIELEQGKIACVKLLESAGCEATEVRVNALLRTPEKERKALLESFSAKPAKQKPARSPSALFESSGQGTGDYPKDIKDFKAVLR